jgi:hypothetical protein
VSQAVTPEMEERRMGFVIVDDLTLATIPLPWLREDMLAWLTGSLGVPKSVFRGEESHDT